MVIVEDCCADIHESRHNAVLEKMAISYSYVVTSKDLINIWV